MNKDDRMLWEVVLVSLIVIVCLFTPVLLDYVYVGGAE